MGSVLLWACFLTVLAGIGVSLCILLREVQRQRGPRADLATAASGSAPRPPLERTGRALGSMLPSPPAPPPVPVQGSRRGLGQMLMPAPAQSARQTPTG